MAADLVAWLPALSESGSTATMRLPRYTEALLYLRRGNPDVRIAAQHAIVDLYRHFDFDLVDDPPGRLGSWWKSFTFRTKMVMTSDEVTSRLARMEQALELATTGKPQSEIDVNQATAIASLLQATQDDDGSSLFVGSSIITRWKDENGKTYTYARSLTSEEMIRYRADPNYRQELMLERFIPAVPFREPETSYVLPTDRRGHVDVFGEKERILPRRALPPTE